MKIIVVGASGILGRAVVAAFKSQHEVIEVSRSSKIAVDITSIDSIKNMYAEIGAFDALIATVGNVVFKELKDMTTADFATSLNDKLMGQVNLVQCGMEYINSNGSFTLTSGILSHEPIRTGTAATMVNAAIDGYVKAASLEYREQARINAISPTLITESVPIYQDYFPGFKPVTAAIAAQAYVKSVCGIDTGKVYIVE